MTHSFHFPLTPKRNRNVMETIMKPLEWTKRPGRWLMAAAMAMGLAQAPALAAETATPLLKPVPAAEKLVQSLPEVMQLEEAPGGPPAVDPKIFFTKTGGQIDCDYVVYKLHFEFKVTTLQLSNPAYVEGLKKLRLDLSDQLPSGLSIVSASVAGDVTDAGGGGAPSVAISTTATADDTATMADFRMSAADIVLDGSPETRAFDVKITAKIDRAAFPAATMADNQAILKVTRPIGAPLQLLSHDPALPDDGNFFTGEKTKISIDVTKCDPPGKDDPGGECFKIDTGTVDCDKSGSGDFIYHMTVGADMAGKVIERHHDQSGRHHRSCGANRSCGRRRA